MLQNETTTTKWCSCHKNDCDTCAWLENTQRRNLVESMRALADLLENNPDIPVGHVDTATIQHNVWGGHQGHEQAIAEVARVADVLGVAITHVSVDTGDHYKATLELPGASYKAIYIANEVTPNE